MSLYGIVEYLIKLSIQHRPQLAELCYVVHFFILFSNIVLPYTIVNIDDVDNYNTPILCITVIIICAQTIQWARNVKTSSAAFTPRVRCSISPTMRSTMTSLMRSRNEVTPAACVLPFVRRSASTIL